MPIADVSVAPISDGSVRLSASYFANVDWRRDADLAPGDGILRLPIGAYLVEAAGMRMLIDAGLGPRHVPWAEGGRLPLELLQRGVAPSAVDMVICTHLHLDHMGWLAVEGRPFFERAVVRFGAADFAFAVQRRPRSDPNRQIIEALDRAGCLSPIDADDIELVPGVRAIATPGHTMGHISIVIGSGSRQLALLGDAVTLPRQIERPMWMNTSDVDPMLAAMTRDALWRRFSATGTFMTAAHFPGHDIGRVVVHEDGFAFRSDEAASSRFRHRGRRVRGHST
jgi:glyoxylase-like metal-dependent hydrolase (beta-lactamase superfamily II)